MKRYEGKVCLVTASTNGIGYTTAERIAVEGGDVIICSREQVSVQKAVMSIKAAIKASRSIGSVEGLVVNVGNEEHRKKAIDFTRAHYGVIDVLVLNPAEQEWIGE